MAKFKVVMGTHVEDGKSYTKDKIVNSTHDLVELFPGKFIRLDPPESDWGDRKLESVAATPAPATAPAPAAAKPVRKIK